MNNKILLMGLGNDLRSDDGVGLAVVREVKKRLDDSNGIDVKESPEMGMALLDDLIGYNEVVLVDSVQTGKFPPGSLHELDENNLKVLHGASPHYMGISEVLALGRAIPLHMPHRLKIFAIEVNDPFTISTEISTAVSESIPTAATRVLKYLEELDNGG
jgi:hydrogenase maturation protease